MAISETMEISEVMCYLPDKKNFTSLSCYCVDRSPYCVDCAQNLPGPAADNVLKSAPDFIQIGSLLVEL